MEESEVTKPEDWPRNWRELRLTEIYEALHEFINTPNFKTREKLLAFIYKFMKSFINFGKP